MIGRPEYHSLTHFLPIFQGKLKRSDVFIEFADFSYFLINSVHLFKMTSSGGNKESMYKEEMVEWEKELKEVQEQVGFFDGKEMKYFINLRIS